MKIVSCFSDPKEVKPLARAGASELYCAVAGLPAFGEPAFLKSMAALRASVDEAKALGVKVALAVNSHGENCFTTGGESVALRRLAEADAAGVHAFIAANPGIFALLARLPGRRAAIHLSSVQPCFNSLTAAFFIRLGVRRLIFPNQLAPHEAREILALCRKKKIETEIFDYRFFGCAYVNGRCSLHRPDFYTLAGSAQNGSMCRLNLSAGSLEAPCAIDADPAWKPRLPAIVRRLSGRLSCGGAPRMANMASFLDFYRAGVGFIKYGTRQDTAEVKVRKVEKVRAMLELADGLFAAHPEAEARRRFMARLQKWDGTKF